MADQNPFAAAATADPEVQSAVASAAISAAPALAGVAASQVRAALPGAADAAQQRWQNATGPKGWWMVFAILDVVLGITMAVNGSLMVFAVASTPCVACAPCAEQRSAFDGEVASDDGAVTSMPRSRSQCPICLHPPRCCPAPNRIALGDVSFLTTFCLGLYFVVFSILSLLSSFIWFTCLGKFIGFFYFMWGRGAFYLIFGTMSLTWPFACFDVEGGCAPVKWASVIVQFVVSVVMSIVGIAYVVLGFVPVVSKLYRPIFGDPKCRTANVVVASEEYWYGKDKFDQKYGVADMQKDPSAATAPHMMAAQQAQFS